MPAFHYVQRAKSSSTLKGKYTTLPDEKEEVATTKNMVRSPTNRETLKTSESGHELQSGITLKERNQSQQWFITRKNLIIVSPARGGSSFFGALFNSNPQVMYIYEPLYSAFAKRKEPKNYKQTCINVIDSFFKCNFNSISQGILSDFSSNFYRSTSIALSRKYLPQISNTLLSKACNTYNHTVIKILSSRMPSESFGTLKELFQQQNRYDVKLVHLVRDPRAVVFSRVKIGWIENHLHPSFRKSVKNLCDLILQNVRFGLFSSAPWLKNRFKVIRYEDVALDAVNVAKEVYRFAGIEWSVRVEEWVSTHTNRNHGGAYSLSRNAAAVIDGWKNAPEPLIQAVDDTCGDLMDFLGYEKWRK